MAHPKPLGNVLDIIPAIIPIDLEGAAGGVGDYISLKNAAGVVFVFLKAAGTANDDPTLTFSQAQDVGGTGAKAFNAANGAAGITTYHKKQGALLTAVGSWTEVTQAAAATIVGNGTSAEEQLLLAAQIDAADLDIDNGFDCIVCDIADTGAAGAQLGAALWVLYGLAYPSAPAQLPSAIVD